MCRAQQSKWHNSVPFHPLPRLGYFFSSALPLCCPSWRLTYIVYGSQHRNLDLPPTRPNELPQGRNNLSWPELRKHGKYHPEETCLVRLHTQGHPMSFFSDRHILLYWKHDPFPYCSKTISMIRTCWWPNAIDPNIFNDEGISWLGRVTLQRIPPEKMYSFWAAVSGLIICCLLTLTCSKYISPSCQLRRNLVRSPMLDLHRPLCTVGFWYQAESRLPFLNLSLVYEISHNSTQIEHVISLSSNMRQSTISLWVSSCHSPLLDAPCPDPGEPSAEVQTMTQSRKSY